MPMAKTLSMCGHAMSLAIEQITCGAERSLSAMYLPILVDHDRRDFFGVANGRIAAGTAPGTALAATATIAGEVIGTGAVAGIGCDRFCDNSVFDLRI